MGRPPRFFRPDELQFITMRCIERMLLLAPCPKLKQIVLYVLIRALRSYPELKLYAFNMLSNHYHAIVSAKNPNDIADFFRDVNGQLSKRINKLRGRKGPMWEDRYHAEPILDDETAWEKLLYVHLQAPAAGLTDTCADWDQLALTTLGESLGHGPRQVKTGPTEAERRRAQGDPEKLAIQWKSLRVHQLPHLDHLSKWEYADMLRKALAEEEQEHRDQRRLAGRTLPTKNALRCLNPFSKPRTNPGRGRRPRCHTNCPKRRQEYLDEFEAFWNALRQASQKYRAGKLDTKFPRYAFRPPVPVLKEDLAAAA